MPASGASRLLSRSIESRMCSGLRVHKGLYKLGVKEQGQSRCYRGSSIEGIRSREESCGIGGVEGGRDGKGRREENVVRRLHVTIV